MNGDAVWKRVFYQPQDQIVTKIWNKIDQWPVRLSHDPYKWKLKAVFEGMAASPGQLQMQQAREGVLKQCWDQIWEEINGRDAPL